MFLECSTEEDGNMDGLGVIGKDKKDEDDGLVDEPEIEGENAPEV